MKVVRTGVCGVPPPGAFGGDGFVEGAEQSVLLCRRSIDEIPSEKFVALLVDAREAGEKIPAFIVEGPFGEDDVYEFIDASTFGAGRVGRRNDLIDHRDDGVILVRVERAQRLSRGRVRALEKRKTIRLQSGQNAAGHQQSQRFTPMHKPSRETWFCGQIIFALSNPKLKFVARGRVRYSPKRSL